MSLYVGVVLQAVPAAASRVLRRHMRTSLKSLHLSIHCGSRGTLSPPAAQATAARSDLIYTDTELIVKI